MARPEVTRKFAVGLFCGGAFHDVAFTRVDGCNVVRLHDWELRMRKVTRSFFPEEGVVRDVDIRAGNVGVLEADIGSAVPADDWLHLNAGLPCQDGSKANRRPHPARLREHVATFFMVVQRMRAQYRKVAWFAENVACAEFVGTMKVLFPEEHCPQKFRGFRREISEVRKRIRKYPGYVPRVALRCGWAWNAPPKWVRGSIM